MTNPVTGKTYKNGFVDEKGDFVSLPLMDGGIYDNQGVASAVLADYKEIFDLFLISDTSPRNEDMLNFPTSDTRPGWVTIQTLFWAAVALFIAAVINVGVLAYYFFTALDARRASWFELTLFYIAPAFFSLVVAGMLIWIYGLFRRHRTITVSGATFPLWHVVKKLAIPDFIEMVKARFSSLATLAGNVFMKRIRQLQFSGIINDARRGKLVSFNLIYDLNPSFERAALWKLAPDLKPTDRMVEISKTAEAFATTLWIDKKNLDNIIVCGQITTCFSLLKYLWRRWQLEDNAKSNPAVVIPKPDNPASPYYEIYQKLFKKWLELKANPQSSLNRKRV